MVLKLRFETAVLESAAQKHPDLALITCCLTSGFEVCCLCLASMIDACIYDRCFADAFVGWGGRRGWGGDFFLVGSVDHFAFFSAVKSYIDDQGLSVTQKLPTEKPGCRSGHGARVLQMRLALRNRADAPMLAHLRDY